MPKRSNRRAANGAGTIKHRSDGRWEAQVTIGRDPATGRLKRKSVYGKTQKEVREKLTALSSQLDGGTFIEPSKLTFAAWLKVWLETYCGHLAPRTMQQYTGYVNSRVAPVLGNVKLSKLTPVILQQFYNDLSRELSPKTIHNIHGVIHKSLQQAVDIGYLSRNPTTGTILPRIEKRQIKPLSGAEMTEFLQEAAGSRYEQIYLFALLTGMRLGEIRGLAWDRVNLESPSILIDRQLQHMDGKDVFLPPKHNKVRSIIPAASVMKILHQQHRKQLEMKLQAGELWTGGSFVFCNELGDCLSWKSIYDGMKRISKKTSRSDLRFHDLRHTHAVNALKAGVDPKTLSENLGHFSVAFTLDVYAFALDEMKQTAADKLDTFMSGYINAV